MRGVAAGTRPSPRPPPQGGFTLIETLVALLILAFVLFGVATHLVTTIQSLAQARHMTDAVNLTQAALETLVDLPYATVASGANPGNPVTETGAAGGIYTVNWVVTADSPAAGLKDVVVSSAWTDKEGTHSVRLRTVIAP
jgi:prepilin-type N-terminal cleavage/methylation domain-containing protein